MCLPTKRCYFKKWHLPCGSAAHSNYQMEEKTMRYENATVHAFNNFNWSFSLTLLFFPLIKKIACYRYLSLCQKGVKIRIYKLLYEMQLGMLLNNK